MSSGQQRDEDLIDTVCGHTVSRTNAISIPEVGYQCRDCYTPIPFHKWPNTIDTSTAHHMTGESTQYKTWLVGLDEKGRGVYHDEWEQELHVLVPKYHRAFRHDIDPADSPYRKRPGKHNPGPGEIVNAPDNGVFVIYDRIETDSSEYSKRALAEYLAANAADWDALSEYALDRLEYYADRYDKPQYDDDVFPVKSARRILNIHRS